MADNKIKQDLNDVADYSGYFKKPEPVVNAPQAPSSPLQELPSRKAISKKLKILISVLIILAAAQFVLLYMLNRSKNPSLPEGYQLINTGNGPPVIAPIK